MPKIKKSGRLSPFFLSALLHLMAIYLVALFPPTKSIIFFKIHKNTKSSLKSSKEKILEEISVVTIPKKNSLDNVNEVLNEEIGHVQEEDTFIPHIDFAKQLEEKLDLSFPIDSSSSFQLSELAKLERPYEDYLTPLYNPIPQELLSDEEPKALAFDPQIKKALIPTPIESEIAQIDEYGLPNVTKLMPEMLDAELYTYRDPSNEQYFKMELKLKDHKLIEDIAQEFLFIIDLTQKSSRKNLALYKDAIFKSMKFLKKHDKFNIAFLGKSLNFLYKESKPCAISDEEQFSKDFKKAVQFNGKFKDVIRHLATVFDKTEENQLHTHCLFFTEEPTQDKTALLNLTKYSHSKLSVYPIAFSEEKVKRETLKTLVESMSGKMLTPPTKASFSRKFNALILDIKKTRLRNVSVKVDSDEGPLDVSLSEKTKQMVLQKPLKIFGKLKSHKNLKLQIVGSHGDDLFEMTKNLSIQGAKKGSSLIKQELENHNEVK